MAKGLKRGKHHDLALTFTAVLVVAGVMILQILARRVKRACEGFHHASDILEASERELTVLGLIAFGLFVMERATTKGDWYYVFHEVHFALFSVALFYVVLNISLYRLSRNRGKLWRMFEAKDLADHAGLAKRLHELRAALKIPALQNHLFFGSYWISGLLRHPFMWFEYQRCLEQMTFHEVRRDFLRVHRLPSAFSFAAYLETCLQHVCLEFSEIRDTVWFLGILGLIVHLFITTMLSAPSAETTLTWLGATVIFLSVFTFLKVKWIYWYVLHSELLFSGSTGRVGALVSSRRKHANFDMQLSLFWFSNPSFVVTLLELCLFALSSCVALLVFKMKSFYKSGDFATPLSVIAVAIVVLVVLLPRIVPRFTLITHVGELSDPRRIAAVFKKQHARGDFDTRKPTALRSESSRRFLLLSQSNAAASSLRDVSKRFVSKRAKETMEDPRISNMSAIAVVAFVFLVAVTLDEQSARGVLANGHVLVIRDVELALGCFFLVESALRLFYRPFDRSRQIDVLLVYACVGCNIASFILRPNSPSYALHAASTAIVFRIFNTAWHNEIAKPRFEHLALSPKELLKLSHGGHGGHGGGHGGHGDKHHFSPDRVAPVTSDPHDDVEEGKEHTDNQPTWVGFLAVKANSSNVDLEALGRAEEQAERKLGAHKKTTTSENNNRDAAAEKRATALVKAALAAADSPEGTVDDVVERSLRLALRRLVSHENDASGGVVVVDIDEKKKKAPLGVSSSSQDLKELEDALYFNHIIRTSEVKAAKEMPSRFASTSLRSRIGRLVGDHHPASTALEDAFDVQLILTRDQLVWYDLQGEVSELVGDSGKVRRVPAKDAPKLKAVALDDLSPDGYVHLSTVLKVDVHGANLLLTTTSHVAQFKLKSRGAANDWKNAVLAAIDQEDDDDPVDPLHSAIVEAEMDVVVEADDEPADDEPANVLG
mmetsp:Transcript_13208/g.43047  ORF Transcript_13208/g.43047 Transcript_13208/m.43047 type:complete len:943 (-) Transcript_13208:338-3166(-)